MADHQRAGGDQVGVVGQREEAGHRHRDELGQRAVAVLAHDVGVQAQGLVTGTAIAAMAAEGARIEDGLLADFQPAAGGRLGNDTGGFHALHQRQSMCDSGAVVAHVQVDPVEPDRMHTQQGLALGRHGAGEVSQLQAFAAPLRQNGCFHGASLRSFACVR